MRLLLFIVLVSSNLSAALATTLISPTVQGGATASGGSYQPALNGDGRYVAFSSYAPDLISPPIDSRYLNVFVRDRLTGQISLISVATNNTSGGDGDSLAAAMSADGRFVAFESAAGNLAPNDTNGAPSGDLSAIVPVTTSSGGTVVFESNSNTSAPDDLNLVPDVFLRDVISETTILLSGRGDLPSSMCSTRTMSTLHGRRFFQALWRRVPRGRWWIISSPGRVSGFTGWCLGRRRCESIGIPARLSTATQPRWVEYSSRHYPRVGARSSRRAGLRDETPYPVSKGSSFASLALACSVTLKNRYALASSSLLDTLMILKCSACMPGSARKLKRPK